jgi:hypothetical protein
VKVLLVVKRDDDVFWVENAVDEFTIDDVGIPDTVQKEIDRDPQNTRTLWVSIPDDSLSKLWAIPTVAGAVTA